MLPLYYAAFGIFKPRADKLGSCTSHGSLTCDDVNEADDAQAEVRLEDLQDDLVPGPALPDVEVVLLEAHLGSWETSTEMDSHGRSPSTFFINY